MINSCDLRFLLFSMPHKAQSICRKVGKKLRRPALHAFKIHCGTESVRIAPPNTMTESYTRFLPKIQPYVIFSTRTPKSEQYSLTLPKYTVLKHWWVVYAIVLLCWSTRCFNTLFSYTQQFLFAEIYTVLTDQWGIHCLITLQSNYQF